MQAIGHGSGSLRRESPKKSQQSSTTVEWSYMNPKVAKQLASSRVVRLAGYPIGCAPTNAGLLEPYRRSKVGNPEKTADYLKTGPRYTWIAANFMGGAVQ
jgi:hypothetical protein